MDPNYKEDEEGSGSSSNNAQGASGPVKLDASKAKKEPGKKGCC